ncbi:DUF5946 family protein [Nonomuraea pusilla]|uniref:Uncharacterized protein n=1 Tax=Nonomuraea pusilla TaxID=46177 RepID=A0A1H7Q524_9ACTN|nr:DUF5946 family protein [Nonomuraea pusilla]SEL43082.1 hypothetical protein SAMN05660976_02423 [Nonomuraea pusilla]
MTESHLMDRCDCGATAGPLGLCADYYHAILAEEQADPQMYRWHTVVVCAYLLQHPPRAHAKYLDGQFRLLQLYVDKGLDALLRVAAHQVARNNHRTRSVPDARPLAGYAPLPPGEAPRCFRATFCGLPFGDGGFVADGHAEYGNRIEAIAQATVEAWRSVA